METLELEDLVYTYPEYDVKHFQTLISAKEEFKEVEATVKEPPPKRGELFRHQKFIKRLMLQYDEQLIIHSVGTGKTCSVIAVTEHFKAILDSLEEIRTRVPDVSQPPFKRAYILVKGENLANEFKFQIMCKCTPGNYITEQILNSKTEIARKGNVTRSLARFYTVKTYGVFVKKLLKMTDEQLRNEFDNSIFIVDEIHNIIEDLSGIPKQDKISGTTYYVKIKKNKKTGLKEEKLNESRLIYDQLWRLFHTVKPRKVMLLSATPMINDPSELRSRLNLILPADRQMPINLNLKTANLEELEPYFRGLISYVRALETGAIPVYQGKVLEAKLALDEFIDQDQDQDQDQFEGSDEDQDESEESEEKEKIEKQKMEKIKKFENLQVEKEKTVKSQTIIYGDRMLKKQNDVYNQTKINPMAFRPESKKPEAFDDLQRQAANFVFPDGSIGSVGYNKYVIEEKNKFKANPELKKWLSDPELLKSLSTKFAEIVKICKNEEGNCWCYTDYIRGSGAVVLGLCFEGQGFERFVSGNSIFSSKGGEKLAPLCGGKSLDDVDVKDRYIKIDKKLRFGLLTSATSSGEAAVLLEAFNSYENRNGEYIKALIGSPVTRDGLNLANVLQIHLVGPGWNKASTYQAESRAIRSTSHVDLIEEEKLKLIEKGENPDNAYVTIKVYQHAALNDEGTSIDTQMYALSEIKDRQIKRVMRMMKQVATDCQINYKRNVRPKDIDGSQTCDYDICAYKCFDPIPEYTDYSSFDVLYSRDNIEGAKNEIINIFRVVFRMSYLSLYNELKDYRKKFIDLAATELIEKRTPIINRYGYINYLREDNGILFLRSDFPINFKEEDSSISLSEYSSNLLGIKTLTLNEYNGILQRGKKGDILDIFEGLSSEEISDKIDNLTLENKILLLETAISSYYISKIKNEIIENIIRKFRSFIFFVFEPVDPIKIVKEAISKRGTGRGRKPKEGTKFEPSEKQIKEIEKSMIKSSSKEIIYFHNLSIATPAKTSYAITSKSRKISGKIRLLKISENTIWRDANDAEEIIYNLIIKQKIEKEKIKFDIYGTIEEDKQFRIIDKTKEEEVAKKDIRKVIRGKICNSGWKRKDLVDLMWKLKFNPFKIQIDFNRPQLISYIVNQNIGTQKEVEKFENEKLEFYFTWYTSGVSIAKICDLLKDYLDKTDRLVKI